MKRTVSAVVVSALWLAGGTAGWGQSLELTHMKPAAVEWGTEKHDLFPNMAYGARVCDYMSAGNQGFPWKDDLKIVKAVEPGKRFPEGTAYNSAMNDVFAVGGEFTTGVGLWARRMSFYYWIEYDIPPLAKTFKATLYVTDDPRGFQWWGLANQQFAFQVLVDGKEVFSDSRLRTKLEPGMGEKLKELKIQLPRGAKKIRFRLVNSSWGDGNANTELVLHEGRFAR